jgi:glycerol-3-phosphate acyltransferase PlsY
VKGILSVLIVKLVLGDIYLFLITSLISAVFGHCYSIWLKFKGGRGLATAAGGAIVLSPLILLFWILAWFVIKKWKNDIHLANSGASFVIIVICFLFGDFLNNYTYPPASGDFIFTFSISLLMIIILTKHIEPLYKMLRKQN